MRNRYLVITIFFFFSSFFLNEMISNSGGAPSGRSGSPVDVGTCADAGCHNSFALNSGPAEVSISSDVPQEGFMPGQTYSVNIKAKESGKMRFGFEVLAYGTTSGDGTGNVTITELTRTKVNPGGRQYVTHTNQGIDATDSIEWSFDWTAPAAGENEVIFYSAINVSNRNGNVAGDFIYTLTDTIVEQSGTAVEQLRDVAATRVFPVPAENQLFVELEITRALELNMEVLDLQGRRVWSLQDNVGVGVFSTSIDVSGWPAGVYMLVLQNGRETGYQKVIVK